MSGHGRLPQRQPPTAPGMFPLDCFPKGGRPQGKYEVVVNADFEMPELGVFNWDPIKPSLPPRPETADGCIFMATGNYTPALEDREMCMSVRLGDVLVPTFSPISTGIGRTAYSVNNWVHLRKTGRENREGYVPRSVVAAGQQSRVKKPRSAVHHVLNRNLHLPWDFLSADPATWHTQQGELWRHEQARCDRGSFHESLHPWICSEIGALFSEDELPKDGSQERVLSMVLRQGDRSRVWRFLMKLDKLCAERHQRSPGTNMLRRRRITAFIEELHKRQQQIQPRGSAFLTAR